jgi:hypothetical protein
LFERILKETLFERSPKEIPFEGKFVRKVPKESFVRNKVCSIEVSHKTLINFKMIQGEKLHCFNPAGMYVRC